MRTRFQWLFLSPRRLVNVAVECGGPVGADEVCVAVVSLFVLGRLLARSLCLTLGVE